MQPRDPESWRWVGKKGGEKGTEEGGRASPSVAGAGAPSARGHRTAGELGKVPRKVSVGRRGALGAALGSGWDPG